jgi:hypothetical protein
MHVDTCKTEMGSMLRISSTILSTLLKTLYSWTGTNHNKNFCLPSLSLSSCARSVHAGCLNDGNRTSHGRVHLTKQNKMPFSEFVDTLHHDNLLLKGSQYHLSPPQLRTQIKSNISPELASVFDRWKDNHESSDGESDKENEVLDGPEDDTTTSVTKASTTALKVEMKIQSFIDMLTKLDQKLIKDHNACRCDAEDAAHSLKCSSSTAGLSDSSRRPPHTRSQPTASASSCTQATSSLSSSSCPPKLMDCERLYLENYSRCKKCHGFYLPDGHPCKFPTGDGYVKCTMAFMNEARKHIKLPPLPVPCYKHPLSVASVNNMSFSNVMRYVFFSTCTTNDGCACIACRGSVGYVRLPCCICLFYQQVIDSRWGG